MDADAELVACWIGAPTLPARPHTLHAVFAYPSQRLATLRHWQDTLETDVDGAPLVAHEASKWARLLLKGHAGAKAICLHPLAHEEAGLGEELAGIAARIDGDDIEAWRDAAGWDAHARHARPLITAKQRFERLERWLLSVRCHLDHGATSRLNLARQTDP